MNKVLSAQLDGMRGFAALYILAHHYFKGVILPSPIDHINISSLVSFGQEGVVFSLCFRASSRTILGIKSHR